MRKLVLLLMLLFVGSSNAENFIIKKQLKEDAANLSKDAIKARMGEAVREGMHALIDSASSLVVAQRLANIGLIESCALHEKIITLERKLSRVAESLIDGHFVYKKNHKKRLELSLDLLRSCALDCKDAHVRLQVKSVEELRKNVSFITTKFTSLESKLASDVCLRAV